MDGSQQQRLTNNPADDGSPKWSPDGTQIVFSSDRGRAQYECNLYVMSADGSNVMRLTNLTYSQGSAICPAWKPRSTTSVEDGGQNNVPQDFKLHRNYPDPFNPSTTTTLELSKESQVTLEIFDSLGRKVKSLFSERRHSGKHSVVWDGTDSNGERVASGMCLFRMATGPSSQQQKVLLLQ